VKYYRSDFSSNVLQLVNVDTEYERSHQDEFFSSCVFATTHFTDHKSALLRVNKFNLENFWFSKGLEPNHEIE
jgi:hypothetical protein